MTKESCCQILSLLQFSYPKYYANFTKESLKDTVNVWAVMFADEDDEEVLTAVKFLINNSKFPPSIAEIKEQIVKRKMKDIPDENMAWMMVKRALMNSGYNAATEFAKLPPMIQMVVGSAAQLHRWALMDIDEIDSFVMRDFMRNYNAQLKSQQEFLASPSDIKNWLGGGINTDVKRIGGANYNFG